MNELRRHQLFYNCLLPFIQVFNKWKFNYEFDSLKNIEGPYLILPNHNLELDPLLIGVATGRHTYFVASEHLLRKGFGTKFIMYFVKPIIHMKGRQGAKTVKQMLRTLQEGNSVCIFPEGNRSFNGVTMEMQASIAKVAKKAKVKLITYRVEGGYFTQPRWSVNLRRGKVRGRLINIYEPEQLAEMSDDQISAAIMEDLHEDAYETQKREHVKFKGKNLAVGLESTIFTCPKCGKIGKLHSQNNRFFCECGFEALYDVYGDLTDKEGMKYTVTELDKLQTESLKQKLEGWEADRPLFEDYVTIYRIGANHELIGTEEGSMKAYTDHLECGGERLNYADMDGMAIYSRNAMIIHHPSVEGHLEVKSGIGFNALKYLYLYNFRKEK
jgi:1-acyl-sn-glycerol-3-phosphate acyltransferase